MKNSEILVKARELLSRGWTKGRYAQTIHNEPTLSFAGDAVAWCSVGAINAAAGAHCPEVLDLVKEVVNGPFGLPAWNDAPERTKEEVLSAFDRAIELARSREVEL